MGVFQVRTHGKTHDPVLSGERVASARDARLVPIAAGLICVGIAFAIYVRTLAPTVYTFDSAEFAAGAYCLGLIHPTGYPLYLLVAHLFTALPFGDVAYRVNLMSAVFGAITTGLLYAIGYELTRRSPVAAASALLYAFSHYYWSSAVIAEVYTLHTAFTAGILFWIVRHWQDPEGTDLAVGGLVLGLGMANHMSMVLTIPGLVFWALKDHPGWASFKRLGLIGIPMAAGLLIYFYLPLRTQAHPPLDYARLYFETDLTTVQGIAGWVTAAVFRPYMAGYAPLELVGQAGQYLVWLWTNFVGAGVVLGVVGLVRMLRRQPVLGLFFLIVYAMSTLFFVSYRVVDKDTMFSVSYLAWAVWVCYGASAVDRLWSRRPLGEMGTCLLAILAAVSLVANWGFADQSRNRMAPEYAGRLLRQVLPSAFIITEWTWATPLEYYQIVENRRPDVVVYDRGLAGLAGLNWGRDQGMTDQAALEWVARALVDRIHQELARRPVYVTDYDPELARQFEFVTHDGYYQLVPRAAAP